MDTLVSCGASAEGSFLGGVVVVVGVGNAVASVEVYSDAAMLIGSSNIIIIYFLVEEGIAHGDEQDKRFAEAEGPTMMGG